MIRYPILHSGFVAHNDTQLQKTEYNSNPFVENVLIRQSGNNEFANLFYSSEITELYKKYQANTNLLSNINERERVLKLAALAFGKNGLSEWLEIQNKFAKVSFSHLEFILDTIRFIATGQRDTSLGMWENLIQKTNHGPFVEMEKSEALRVLLKEVRPFTEGYISSTLHAWVGHVGGYGDLLYTLWLIFGDKSYSHHVAVQSTGG